MNLKATIVKCILPLCAVALLLSGIFNSDVRAQTLCFNIGDATVDISSGTGIASASFTIVLENPTDGPLDIAAYSLFLEIDDPSGLELPLGVTFDTTNGTNDAVTYISGNGNAPLVGAGQEPPAATINLEPAAGDLGLGQIQFVNGTLAAGASADLLTVNLLIDRSTAVAGNFAIGLSPDGQNLLSTVEGSQPFGSTFGSLRLESAPVLLGDVDLNGVVNFADIGPFIAILASDLFQAEADITLDGVVTFADIGPFIALLSAQ